MRAGKHLAPVAVQLKLTSIYCVLPKAEDEQRPNGTVKSSLRFGYPNSPLHLKRNTPLEFIDKAHPLSIP